MASPILIFLDPPVVGGAAWGVIGGGVGRGGVTGGGDAGSMGVGIAGAGGIGWDRLSGICKYSQYN